MLVYQEFGIALPDSPGGQMGYGTPVSGAPQAGDLLFWSEDGSGVITHVGIAMGDGTTIHASNYAGEVTITDINYVSGYVGARRLL
jgi:cell wall-associated NlpC family hydrolase